MAATRSAPSASMKPTMPTISYERMRFAEVPGWNEDDHLAAFKAFLKSCERVLVQAHERAGTDKAPPAALVAACMAAGNLKQPTRAAARAFFEENFTANAVSHDGSPGLLTGYYEPLIAGSRTAEGIYQTPVYKRPPDLVNLVEESERAAAANGLSHARKTEKGIEPFATRAQIDQGILKGRNLELLYCADPVDVFFMQIQGSGRVKLTDGNIVRLHYDGKNGHPYTSIGRYLIEKGLLAADKMSMGALSRWLKSNPDRAREVMWQNTSYVFFRELKGAQDVGPLGAMNAPLTAGRSLAVDTSYHSLGMPIFVTAAADGSTSELNRLMIAQDVGSAIRGPERGDIFFGSGEAAGRAAGSTKRPGTFIVLLPNETPQQAATDVARQQ